MDFSSQHITALYAKKLAGEATEAELNELQEYLQLHPEEQYFQELFSNWWESRKTDPEHISTQQEEHFQSIIQRTSEKEPSFETIEMVPVVHINHRKRWLSVAAAAVLVGIISFGIWKSSSTSKASIVKAKQIQENEIVAKRGTKSKLLLPDGTQVWLNSDSKLIYNSAFDDSLREVTLDGEAYFDVVKDPTRPFIVHTSGINIRVLGTAFNVKSYAQEATIEATLVHGLIEVEKTNEPKASKILLHPNEKLIFNKPIDKVAASTGNEEPVPAATPVLKPLLISINPLPRNSTDSNRIETSWVYGKLLFEGDSFRDLALKMERWFNIKISFKNNRVANYRFGGVFENENIEEALQYLQMVHAFSYTIQGNEVQIDKK